MQLLWKKLMSEIYIMAFNQFASDAVYLAIFFSTADGGRLNTHSVFCEFCWEPCQHATRGRDMCRITCTYTQVFLGVRGDTVRWPRTKGTAVNEWVHSFVDFCLIPLSTTYMYQPRICKDGFISIVFDVSLVCCLFDQVRVDNRLLLRSLPTV